MAFYSERSTERVAKTTELHIAFFVCSAIAVIFYLLANIVGAIVLSIVGLGFEVASYVLMFQASRGEIAMSNDLFKRRGRSWCLCSAAGFYGLRSDKPA